MLRRASAGSEQSSAHHVLLAAIHVSLLLCQYPLRVLACLLHLHAVVTTEQAFQLCRRWAHLTTSSDHAFNRQLQSSTLPFCMLLAYIAQVYLLNALLLLEEAVPAALLLCCSLLSQQLLLLAEACVLQGLGLLLPQLLLLLVPAP